MHSKNLDLIKNLSIQAGLAILKIYKTNFSIMTKKDNSPLTLADRASNNIIVNGIKNYFPDFGILSEESKDDKSRLSKNYCFIIDPLDGTKEFVEKNGQFTVNIALAYNQKAIMGVIYYPVKKELYYACEGMGAFLENIEKDETKKISVTNKIDKLIIVKSKSHSCDKEKKLIEDNSNRISEILTVGSSLKGCMIASGEADIYYRFGQTYEWDTAAMQCIVEEAGGIFRQIDGSKILYNRKDNLNKKGFYAINRLENIWL